MTSNPTTQILGFGTSVPEHGADSETSRQMALRLSCQDPQHQRMVTALYRRTKIGSRGSVLLDRSNDVDAVDSFYPTPQSLQDRGPGTKARADRYTDEAPRLAIPAAQAAIASAGIDPDRITHLVTVSCTGFTAPGIDIDLMNGLPLSSTTQRLQIGFMGCHGAINGLRAAHGLVAADPAAVVLMSSVELCSLHYQYGYDADRIVSGALFADGSAAMVLCGNTQPPTGSGDSAKPVAQLVGTGSFLVPDSRDEMTWRIGDHGYEMTLSAKVPKMIDEYLKGYLTEFLAQHGESIDSIGGWATHPGGPRILAAVESGLDLPPQALAVSRSVLAEHGNMSSATMMFILDRFNRQRVPKPWLMLGFGPGLEIETALVR